MMSQHNLVTDILFTEDSLNAQDAIDKVTCEYCGAISLFLGKSFFCCCSYTCGAYRVMQTFLNPT